MKFHIFIHALLLSSSLQFIAAAVSSYSGTVGINYGRLANNLPSPPQVVQLLKAQGITKIKLFDTNSAVLSALSGSGISAIVALPNEKLSSAAASQSFPDTWVRSNILPYLRRATAIDAVAVGNEVFVDPTNATSFLVPAMRNLHASLLKYDAASSVKVSSPIALSALGSSYPPSSGSFESALIEPVIKPMLRFLNRTGSYLMVNAYPFFAYSANYDEISLDYALFRDNSGAVDSKNGVVYKSLLEAQIDAVFAAMEKLGFRDLKIVVTETGWPSKGSKNEMGASKENAAAYNGNLVRRILGGGGTPIRPEQPLRVYLFALFNENEKPGPTSDRNYGLFYPNKRKVYVIPLTAEGLGGDVNGSRSGVAVAAAGQTWCVANVGTGVEKLQKALDYACGEGGADCRPIQSGATCHDPDTVVAHASYAFNSYYQRNGRRSGTCHFGGAAYVVTQHPKFGNCKFPTGN